MAKKVFNKPNNFVLKIKSWMGLLGSESQTRIKNKTTTTETTSDW